MSGMSRKISASTAIFTASARKNVRTLCARLDLIGIAPAIAESGIILDAGESGIDVAEFLADALDEGAHIGAEADFAVSGDEALAMDDVVELAIAHVVTGARHQMIDDLEFGLSQFDADVLPEGARGVAAQLQIAVSDDR